MNNLPTSPPTTLIRRVDLESAQELLDELSPHRGSLWGDGNRSNDERWVFRGERDAVWNLIPSAFREGALFKFVRDPSDTRRLADMSDEERCSPPIETQLAREQGLVNQFVIGVDRQGLEVPGDRPELRDHYAPAIHSFAGFPPTPWRPMFALAQHYGVPTRFLDWSYSPRVAAYFACVDIAESNHKGEPTSDRFAVWALSQHFVQNTARKWDPAITIVTAPTASNPNLRAQQGLFTLVEHQQSDLHGGQSFPPIPTIDQILANPPESPDEPRMTPALWKFTVPSSEAPRLLRFLAHEQVTGAQIYHGHKAVVKAMREQAWHR